MNESDIPIAASQASSPTGPRARKPAAAKRKASPHPKKARRTSAAARPRSARRARPAAPRTRDLQGLLQSFARKAADAGGRLAAASGGAQATRRAWQKVSDASRKTIDRLASEWKQMDTAKKAQFVAALLTTLAAASAPLVRRRLKRR